MASRLSQTGHECEMSNKFQAFNLTADIPITDVDVGLTCSHPTLRLSDTIQCLDRNGKMNSWFFMGNTSKQYHDFWSKWRGQQPMHPVFELHGSHLGRCVPICIHADEGTSQKKRGMLVLQTQVCMGHGTRKRKADQDSPGVNFVGKSLCTRLVYSVMMVHVYSGKKGKKEANPKPLLRLVDHLATELRMLFEQGLDVHFEGALQRIWLVPIAFKGDWPALVKIGQLNRHHLRDTPTKEGGHGICHLCKGGMPSNAWHDVSFGNMTKMRSELPMPWQREPGIVSNLALGDAYKHLFFRIDLFHTCHKGVMADAGANAVASSLQTGQRFWMFVGVLFG